MPRKTQPDVSHEGPQYRAVDLGPLDDLGAFETPHPRGDRATPSRVFVQEALGATGCEVSFNAFPPGAAIPFLHAHRDNEELYVFLGGTGEMLVDGDTFPVREGSVVRCAPSAMRAWRNTGDTTLSFACIQARASADTEGTIEDGIAGESPVPWPQG